MFGIIKGCGMNRIHKKQWTAHYCGLCAALGDNYGPAARMTVNGDAVLLSVLCEAQMPEPCEKEERRCPLRFFRKIPVLQSRAEGIRYGAGISALMGAALIRDHIADADGRIRYAKGFFSSLAEKWQRSVRNSHVLPDRQTESIEQQIQRQQMAEQYRGEDFLFYSRPTEQAAGVIAARTADICRMPENREILSDIGSMFGRIVFLLDSYRDLYQDCRHNKFNALARSFPLYRIQREAAEIFYKAHDEIRKKFADLKLFFPDLAAFLFIEHLGRIGEQSLAMSPAILEEEEKKKRFFDRLGCNKKKCCDGCDCCDCCCDCPDCGDSGGGDCCGCDGCDCGGCDCAC